MKTSCFLYCNIIDCCYLSCNIVFLISNRLIIEIYEGEIEKTLESLSFRIDLISRIISHRIQTNKTLMLCASCVVVIFTAIIVRYGGIKSQIHKSCQINFYLKKRNRNIIIKKKKRKSRAQLKSKSILSIT